MIKNEKQYNTTRKNLSEIDSLIKEYSSRKTLTAQNEMYLSALRMQQEVLAEDILQYEKLKQKGLPLRRKVSVAQIPLMLTEQKIARHLTQKQYAAILGVKEQQLQRWEAEDYASVSLENLQLLMEKAGLHITLSVHTK